MTTEQTDVAPRLKPRTKAAKLRAMMRLIETRLDEGVQHADILQWLNEEGLGLTERTYQSYLYRYRRRQRVGRKSRGSTSPSFANSAASTTAPLAQPNATSKDSSVGRRPPTFDYDPSGIPDLLK